MEYPGALYHVINRGNYRQDLFESVGAAQSFVTTLEEAVARYGWRLHGYVLMRNHFHLVVETPEPNLASGMHWLLGTAAARFNRFRRERGSLFQGRYQALLIEDTAVMSHVVDYVHLNPVRAGIVSADQAGAFRWSSLIRFVRGVRFAGLDPQGTLGGRGWTDTPEGWSGYLEHLVCLAHRHEEQKRLGYDGFSSGWAIGTSAWRREIARQHAALSLSPGLAADQLRDLRESRWREALERQLSLTGHTREEAVSAPRTKDWKLHVALHVRRTSGAAIGWLTRELGLGTEATARSVFSKLRRQEIQQYSP